jgi:hypothetical protein
VRNTTTFCEHNEYQPVCRPASETKNQLSNLVWKFDRFHQPSQIGLECPQVTLRVYGPNVPTLRCSADDNAIAVQKALSSSRSPAGSQLPAGYFELSKNTRLGPAACC